MKKWAVAVLAIVIMGLVGGVYLYYGTSVTSNNMISTGSADVKLQETLSNGEHQLMDESSIEIGKEQIASRSIIEKQISLVNKGNNPAYVRVLVTKVWNGKHQLDENKIEMYPFPILNGKGEGETKDWFVQKCSSSQTIYYYKRVLLPGESSDDIVQAVGILVGENITSNKYREATGNVIFAIEAIQQGVEKKKALERWKIKKEWIDEIVDGERGLSKTASLVLKGKARECVTPIGKWVDFSVMDGGTSRTQYFIIKNKELQSMQFYLTVNLLKRPFLKETENRNYYQLTVNGEKGEIFSTLVDSEGGQTANILGKKYLLGTLRKGEKEKVSITLTLDGSFLENNYQEIEGTRLFIITGEDVNDTKTFRKK
ncbi:hypothetical protein ACTQ6A_03890 [Lachnospiraceae bacterium LCP25S3_G4]